ncbi:MAG: NUDIX hydrolase [bacterium]|nr:NUDIX hydrolase [bacterium]
MAYQKQNKLHIVAVVAVIRNFEGKYLILKRHENEIAYPGMYTFPGGKVEGNDTVEETLAKEVAEEAGLKLKPGKILLKDKSFVRPDGQTAKSFSYLCEVEGAANVTIDADFTDFKWVNLEELKKLPHVGIEEELIRAEDFYKKGFNLDTFGTKSVKQSREEVAALKDIKI